MLNFGNVLNSIQDIVNWITNTVETIEGIFSDVDFTVLYSWQYQPAATNKAQ